MKNQTLNRSFSLISILLLVTMVVAMGMLAACSRAETIAPSSTMLSYTPTTQTALSIVPIIILTDTTIPTPMPTTSTPMPTTSTTANTSNPPNIAGQWHWDLTVTVANGDCAGEEGPQPTYTVQITQNGEDVTISGFLASNPSTSISGKIKIDNVADKWIVTFSGSYPEDQGTTKTSYTLVLNNTFDKMTGDEDWSWSLGNLTCKDCKSTVVANKLP